MANSVHVELVRQGAGAVADWRRQHPDEQLDLMAAHLKMVNLAGADLSGANLKLAYLPEADLTQADLSSANLVGASLNYSLLSSADLSQADLTGTDLTEVNLRCANLTEARLWEANLTGANFSFADLSKADFERAELRETDFANAIVRKTEFKEAVCFQTRWVSVDLSDAKHLKSLRHIGPSTVGLDTLERSQGKIPEVFLRDCGLASWETLFAQMYDPRITADAVAQIAKAISEQRSEGPLRRGGVFISYSKTDKQFANALYRHLSDANMIAWLDRHDGPASHLEQPVTDAIGPRDVLMLVLSERSLKSEWIWDEINAALEREVVEARSILIPVSLDDAWMNHRRQESLLDALRRKGVQDFAGQRGEALTASFQQMMTDLETVTH
jgi:hypothetical protein